ncbi:hypothetical protein NDU88_004399 [Pleurodeles waltl]|uniref:L1 transposable element RRM domain-containing protein n=1 Tax=Pleurodeles waltl TaxID=8319 RepID=A0AAV7M6Z7_PLEWA|nr:hypothetical protein NDU88_004399 [Pleurodeles waltl]
MGKNKKHEEQSQGEAASTKPTTHPTKSHSTDDLSLQETILDTVLLAIRESREALEKKIDNLAMDLTLLRDDHRKLKERVGTNKTLLTAVTLTQKATTAELTALTSCIKILETRAEDAENRTRRSNLRLVGIPEQTETSADSMESFLENWIKTTVAPEGLSAFFAIERAHRVPSTIPPLEARPRPIVAKLLHHRDRDYILSQTRQLGEITCNTQRIMIFPDFTRETQAQRASFNVSKHALRENGIKYAMLFPAKLRVEHDGKTHFFTSPQLVWEWLEARNMSTLIHSAGTQRKPGGKHNRSSK